MPSDHLEGLKPSSLPYKTILKKTYLLFLLDLLNDSQWNQWYFLLPFFAHQPHKLFQKEHCSHTGLKTSQRYLKVVSSPWIRNTKLIWKCCSDTHFSELTPYQTRHPTQKLSMSYWPPESANDWSQTGWLVNVLTVLSLRVLNHSITIQSIHKKSIFKKRNYPMPVGPELLVLTIPPIHINLSFSQHFVCKNKQNIKQPRPTTMGLGLLILLILPLHF